MKRIIMASPTENAIHTYNICFGCAVEWELVRYVVDLTLRPYTFMDISCALRIMSSLTLRSWALFGHFLSLSQIDPSRRMLPFYGVEDF